MLLNTAQSSSNFPRIVEQLRWKDLVLKSSFVADSCAVSGMDNLVAKQISKIIQITVDGGNALFLSGESS